MFDDRDFLVVQLVKLVYELGNLLIRGVDVALELDLGSVAMEPKYD